MAERTKFTEEELKSITDIRDGNSRIISDLGQVELQVFMVTEELEKLEEMKSKLQLQFKNLQVQESELINQLNEKYGIGTVDINTGEFVPEN
jgi:predicted nuclease with TOPRIM domain